MKHAIDWSAAAERASSMTDNEIFYALLDIRKTLDAADALDRETGGNYGGHLRDEASVLHAEMRRRRADDSSAPSKRQNVQKGAAR